MQKPAARLIAMLLATHSLDSVAEAETEPDPGFLEFLGMMVENEGELIDALDMINVDMGTVEPAQESAQPVSAETEKPQENRDVP